MVPWLILDGNFLCHRAFHSTGNLSYSGSDNHILYGVLHTVDNLQSLFSTNKIVWCFDHGIGKRREIYPEYKANRKQKLDTEAFRAQVEFRLQLTDIRDKWLGMMGYRNVFHQLGFEGDDIIASVVEDCYEKGKEAIIISADKDLWQLIQHDNIWCYNPTTRKSMTDKLFWETYGISPVMWPHCKAIAGDVSDNIPGINGIGEKTASKWFAGTLGKDTKAYQKISNGLGIQNRNYQLVKLPLKGVKSFILRKDKVTKDKRDTVLRELRFEK
jgi:DNA polymerase-1